MEKYSVIYALTILVNLFAVPYMVEHAYNSRVSNVRKACGVISNILHLFITCMTLLLSVHLLLACVGTRMNHAEENIIDLLIINTIMCFGVAALSVFNACFLTILTSSILATNHTFRLGNFASDKTLLEPTAATNRHHRGDADLDWSKFDVHAKKYLQSWLSTNRPVFILVFILNLIHTIYLVLNKQNAFPNLRRSRSGGTL
jgi:hypothetical protein